MTYQTKGGESVFELATRFLGNPSRWFQIVELNEEYLTDVHLLEALPPGLVLKIPAPARWESSATPNSASFAQ
jgi:nucleoid-associated protein YgaU